MTTDLITSVPEGFRLLHFAEAPGECSPRCIVWLHGIGERGTDVSLVAKYGLPAALTQDRLTVNADVLNAVRARDGEADSTVIHGEGHYISESALTHPRCVAALASIGIAFAWRRDEA